jgi:hypothetical protein
MRARYWKRYTTLLNCYIQRTLKFVEIQGCSIWSFSLEVYEWVFQRKRGAGVKGFTTCSVLTWKEGANPSPTMAKNKTFFIGDPSHLSKGG